MFWTVLAAVVIALLAEAFLLMLLLPTATRKMIRQILTRPMSDTLAELYVSMRSTPPMDFLYSSLRANSGNVVIRPMGSTRPVHGFDDLALIPAQVARRPALETEPVDLSVTLGRRSHKPLTCSMPLYISGMAYGLAITKTARLALAQASGQSHIPLNSGQGPFLREERQRASHYVLQFGRWTWNREVEILRQADMIEIQVGQGAQPGSAVIATPDEVSADIKAMMHLGRGEAPIIHADLFLHDPQHPSTVAEVVDYLRSVTDGVPIALKMGASDTLEEDLDIALDAGVDTIVIDGTEGATGNAPITLSDHFGIPSLMALSRAVHHLHKTHTRDTVDLLISGGFREPGDFLKAYALGADAVGLGTIAMFALAHYQITQAVPFFPPTDLVFYRSQPKIPLDLERAALGVYHFLESCRKEMEISLRAMGHTAISQLGPDDLCALDPEIAKITDCHYAGTPRHVDRQRERLAKTPLDANKRGRDLILQ
ncbi:MAG: FMN-binding glutamate synthase family protein [Sulfobacillus acidophilus]|uniref:FMN-binding glutamate synthase family protein n=1 Tax=Sulfobacillus acidophilus TaxID=53633 RepID=A0A2T2WJP5_9FIRM|nr:MAG: FMN-binding glutamate synthase family protein [Sulfobacillus acidophilus]